jgi:tetratricopeptide (TPR) repeat protein
MKVRTLSYTVALFLGLLLLSAAPAQAQLLGGLEGEVKGDDGKPLVGVIIQIERIDIKQTFETKTDSNGHYLYNGLPTGGAPRYNVQAVKDGVVLYTFKGVGIPGGETRRLDFDLKQLRKEDETRLTEEQKRMIEERRKAIEKDKNLRAEFDLGRKLLSEPTAANVCAARCNAAALAEKDACVATCQEQVAPSAQQIAYQDAVAAFERASEIDPAQYAVWVNLGRAYEQTRQDEKSIAAYEKAAGLKPEEAPSLYVNLAPLYVRANRVEEAQKGCEKVAPLDPKQGSACYSNIGVVLVNNNRMKEAIEPFQKSVQLDPKRAEAFYQLGVCLLNQAEYRQEGNNWVTVPQPGTREAFEQYLALEPEGRFAKNAKEMLETLGASVPAAVKVKKK